MGLFGNSGSDAAGDALNAIQDVRVPNEADLRVQLEQYVQQGVITPDQAATIMLDPSQFQSIVEDPGLRAKQVGALDEFQNIASEGGLDARANANIQEILDRQRTEARGQREATSAAARRRGIGGSDLEIVQQQLANQGAATRGNQNAIDIAALREQRRDDALSNVANLSGNIRQQDFGIAAQRAAAQDAVNRFNAANQQSQVNRNVDDANRAQALNLGEKQRVADSNVDTRNQQESYNKRLPLDIFNAQSGQAAQVANALQNKGAAQANESNQNRQLLGNLASAAAFAFSDERLKKNVKKLDSKGYSYSDEDVKEGAEPINSRKMLADLNGYSYEYKDPSMGEGEQVGVMAQELEESPFAEFVAEMPEGLAVDYGSMGAPDAKTGGKMMALLADMNKRLSNLEG